MQPTQIVKVVQETTSKGFLGSIKFLLGRLGFYALVVAMTLVVIPIIEDTKVQAENKPSILIPLIFTKNVFFLVIDKVVGADKNIGISTKLLICDDDNCGLSLWGKTKAVLTIFFSFVFLFCVFFGFRIPIINKEISLTDFVKGLSGPTVPTPNILLISFLMFFGFAGWWGSWYGNVTGYIPFEGVVAFVKALWANPKFMLP